MAMKKKETLKAKGTIILDDEDQTYKDLMSDEMMTAFQVNEATVDMLLDSVMNVLKDKEIAGKIPVFSVVSTMSTMKAAINFKDFTHDKRKDDIYIKAEDGEEYLPPPSDNIATARKLNEPDVVANYS